MVKNIDYLHKISIWTAREKHGGGHAQEPEKNRRLVGYIFISYNLYLIEVLYAVHACIQYACVYM